MIKIINNKEVIPELLQSECNADEIFKSRCPYKNAKSRCTAKFECKNQHHIKKFGENPVCTGSDLLDYRPAWISENKLTSK